LFAGKQNPNARRRIDVPLKFWRCCLLVHFAVKAAKLPDSTNP
jgi:hypothetical protein